MSNGNSDNREDGVAVVAFHTGSTPSMSIARSLPYTPDNIASMTPMELLIAQLKSSSSGDARVDAMRRIVTVAEAMGLDSTVNQLIPYLANSIGLEGEEDDEILLILGDQLGKLVPGLVPGSKALPIMSILERLASVEETVVREQAVKSINKIVPEIWREDDVESNASEGQSAANAPALLLAMAKRLSGADWFTAKVSAAGVLPSIYSYFNLRKVGESSSEEWKRELRTLYKDLAEDEAPMVRRSAARHLGAFVEAVAGLPNPLFNKDRVEKEGSKVLVLEDLVPLFHTLSHDEQDSVRLLAVVAAGSIASALKDGATNADVVLPIVRNGCVDLSWRVRNNMAKHFAKVATSLNFTSNSSSQTELFLCFSNLLQDAEGEVRGAAVSNIAELTQLGGPDLFSNNIAPYLPSLSDDPVMEVRSRLAQSLMDCCNPSICNCLSDKIVLQVFRPLLENFLNDEFPEVQLHILSKLDRLSSLLSKMDVVVNHLLQMTKAINWRVREAVAQLLPHLAEAMGLPFFEDHLLDSWLKLLMDKVASVRLACVAGMPKLLSVAGPHWIQTELLIQYNRIYTESTSYLTRTTILRSYASLCSSPASASLLHSQLLDDIIDQLLNGLKDKVANVRIISVQGLMAITPCCADNSIVEAKILPVLRDVVQKDTDDDCKHFAQLTLDGCNG